MLSAHSVAAQAAHSVAAQAACAQSFCQGAWPIMFIDRPWGQSSLNEEAIQCSFGLVMVCG
jgi:hypothetical protein